MSARWRDPVNVPDLMERDKLVRRLREIRAEAMLGRAGIRHWNRTHPGERPLDHAFEDAVIAWCDGVALGAFPAAPTGEP